VAHILPFAMLIWRLVDDYPIAFDLSVLAIDRASSLASFALNTYSCHHTYILFLTPVY
jgi:hypothetical protein